MLDDEFMVTEGTVTAAFHYALGRKSYPVAGVVRDILDNVELLSQQSRQKMIKEIRDRRMVNALGHPNDAEQWGHLHDRLNEIESEGRLL